MITLTVKTTIMKVHPYYPLYKTYRLRPAARIGLTEYQP